MPHASFRALSRSSQKYAAISSPPRSITMGQDQFLPTAISLSSQGFSDSLYIAAKACNCEIRSDASSNQEPTRQRGSQHHMMETSRVCPCPPSSPANLIIASVRQYRLRGMTDTAHPLTDDLFVRGLFRMTSVYLAMINRQLSLQKSILIKILTISLSTECQFARQFKFQLT